MSRTLVSESVTEGHPDKVCDIVSDSLVDAYIRLNPDSRVAVETAIKDGLVLIEGEVSAPSKLDHALIVRQALAAIGYTSAETGLDAEGCGVIDNIRPRMFSHHTGNFGDGDTVDKEKAYNTFGADQGLMIGYACDDTPELIPMPIHIASRLAERLAYVRKNGIMPMLRPDGKTLVAVEYANDNITNPAAVKHILVSAQHSDKIELTELRELIREHVITPVIEEADVGATNAETIINNKPFTLGGPKADAGVTGRKIIVDTYGGMAGHGGGAFSGKDPRKPDRSAAYAARWAAKNIVAAGLARRAQVELGYTHLTAQPIVVDIETFGTETTDRRKIENAVRATFDFRQLAIIDQLDLRRPIYVKTAAYGHFGREDKDFTWERANKVEELLKNLN